MKKILSLLLALSLFFSLIGCKPAGELNAPLQPELQVPTTEATENVTTESTEWLVEWPTEAPTEEIETVPEKTQPPQEEEIIDSRPHPADIAEQDQQQDQYEQNGYQPENRPDTQQPGQGSAQTPAETVPPEQTPTQAPTQAPADTPSEAPYLDPDGHYTSKNEVALYIHLYHRLPGNYITKSQGDRQYGDYHNIPTSMNIGGDRFGNYEGHLPSGYTYYECDIGTSGGRNRGSRRIVFTTSGIVYYTSDHYESFTRLY